MTNLSDQRDPLHLDRAFRDRGWMLYAGDANESSIEGMVEAELEDRSRNSAFSAAFAPTGPIEIFRWLLDRVPQITPYASLKYATERYLQTKIFSRYSDAFDLFASAVKYCPGWYLPEDPTLSAMYTIVLRREGAHRERDAAWDTLHSIGHILTIHRALRCKDSESIRAHIQAYSQWLANPGQLQFPHLASPYASPELTDAHRNAAQVELDADVFAAAAMTRLGRPAFQSRLGDVDFSQSLANRMRLRNAVVGRDNRLTILRAFTEEDDRTDKSICSHKSWLDARPRLCRPGDMPPKLLRIDQDHPLDWSHSQTTANYFIGKLEKLLDKEPYAPLRSLIEYSVKVVSHNEDDFFNLSIHCQQSPRWTELPISFQIRRFSQAVREAYPGSAHRDYTQFVLMVPAPDKPRKDWTLRESVQFVHSLCAIYCAIASKGITRRKLLEGRWLDLTESVSSQSDVDLLTAISCGIWRSPEDLIPSEPWEWSRAVLGLSPFADRFQTKWPIMPDVPIYEHPDDDTAHTSVDTPSAARSVMVSQSKSR